MTDTAAPPTAPTVTYPPITDARPIWQQEPCPWMVADAWAEHLVTRLLADVPALGTDRPGIARDGIEIVYGTEAEPARGALAVCVHADLDGLLVNAFDGGRGFGPDLIPLSARGLGLRVSYGIHPRHGDAWFADCYPRLRAAVEMAAEAIVAICSGGTCDSVAGIDTHEYPCQRPAGHAGLHPQEWADCANGSIMWADGAITSGHTTAVVLR